MNDPLTDISNWVKRNKTFVIIAASIFICIIWAFTDKQVSKTNNSSQQASKPNPAPQPQSQIKQIQYETVKQWDIVTKNDGRLIVISPTNLNEPDMLILGEQLRNEFKNNERANVAVFTDKRAAELREPAAAEQASRADITFYEQHYVGNYTKDANKGYNQFKIWVSGSAGGQTKEVNY